MTEIERIKRYIKRAKPDKNDKYGFECGAVSELASQAYQMNNLPLSIITLAFDYGKAKGYRAAKAEARKAVQG